MLQPLDPWLRTVNITMLVMFLHHYYFYITGEGLLKIKLEVSYKLSLSPTLLFPVFLFHHFHLSYMWPHVYVEAASACWGLWLTFKFILLTHYLEVYNFKITYNCVCKIKENWRPYLRPPLWSSGQSSWLQIQRTRVRYPALPDFLRSSGSGTGSSQPREDNWGATWMEK
jgi:hypothetical protein